MIKEKIFKASSGYLFFMIWLLMLAGGIFILVTSEPYQDGLKAAGIALIVLQAFVLKGFFIVNPNSSKALILFGKYAGTVKSDGFHWANPFFVKQRVSLRARNLETEKIKVNDKLGNPIIISAVVVWQVHETAQALFEVDDYENYVQVQSDAAVRSLAGKYSYDAFEDEGEASEEEVTLRSGGDLVNSELESELSKRLEKAGVEVIEARINHLAYAEEIAGAMLQRQQATAIIAARQKIVDGAVGMVEMALERIEKESVVQLDEERKANMVSNLMVVLCSDKNASPVINTGSLY
jgi:regulator of protease activity HflC (stomatin/prohibitin superfamily)